MYNHKNALDSVDIARALASDPLLSLPGAKDGIRQAIIAAGGTVSPTDPLAQPPLAQNVTLAIGATTNPVSSIKGASYLWNVDGTFTATAELYLEYLGDLGTNWYAVMTPLGVAAKLLAPGSLGVVIGENATLRIRCAVAGVSGFTSRVV